MGKVCILLYVVDHGAPGNWGFFNGKSALVFKIVMVLNRFTNKVKSRYVRHSFNRNVFKENKIIL